MGLSLACNGCRAVYLPNLLARLFSVASQHRLRKPFNKPYSRYMGEFLLQPLADELEVVHF